ncbi:MAG: tetratricopeptide repeat protein [Nitrospirota bacterium]
MVLKKGKLDEAITCCQKALQLNSNFAEPYWNMSLVLLSPGDRE